jgi:hypothetical protein
MSIRLKDLFRVFPFAFSLLLLALIGCDTTEHTEKTEQQDEDEQVSTIPWNKPQKWEAKGVGTGGVGY